MGYKSYKKNVIKKARTVEELNMQKACTHVQGEIMDIISRTQPTRHSRKSGRTIGLDPSKEDEPPKVVTGQLHSSIDYAVTKDLFGVHGFVGVRKGTADKYGLELELGTSRIQPRPFIRRVVKGDKVKIAKIIAMGRK